MRYVQDPKTKKLIPKDEYVKPGVRVHYVQDDVVEFVSTVDGSVLGSRSHVRDHNRRHGVVNGSVEEMLQQIEPARRRREAIERGEPFDVSERRDALRFAWDIHESGRSEADRKQMIENYRRINDGRR